MIDCPPVLHSGADLIVSLSVYFRASAFKPPSTSVSDNTAVFSEGHETLDEQTLRERKHSLLRLFDAVGLKPCGGSDFALRRRETYDELHEEALKKSTQRPTNTEERGKKVKMEIVGDGEEVEVEEGEDLSESELDMIYKR
jgi:DNA repair protein RAD5